MNEPFYLLAGLALLFLREGRPREDRPPRDGPLGDRLRWDRRLRFYLEVAVGLALVTAVDSALSRFFWDPTGRGDFRLVSLVLLAHLADRARRGPVFLALTAFSLAALEGGVELRLFRGLGLVAGTGIFEGLLRGLWKRAELSDLPRLLAGDAGRRPAPTPLLFWLAMLLFLACWGFRGLAGSL